jgi:hypothetical protein
MKYDICKLTLAADTMIPQLTNQRHRAILQNYRKHAMLEVTGRYSEIFTPEMTVDEPFYRVARPGNFMELDGSAAVQDFYGTLVSNETTVMMLENERIAVADWGFASEALYNTFMPARAALARGHRIDDPDATYIEACWRCMIWPYDDQCRMIGEHVYSAPTSTIRKCPADEVLTLKEVQETLAPLIAAATIDLPSF